MGRFRLISAEGKTAVVQLRTGRKIFRSTSVKPFVPFCATEDPAYETTNQYDNCDHRKLGMEDTGHSKDTSKTHHLSKNYAQGAAITFNDTTHNRSCDIASTVQPHVCDTKKRAPAANKNARSTTNAYSRQDAEGKPTPVSAVTSQMATITPSHQPDANHFTCAGSTGAPKYPVHMRPHANVTNVSIIAQHLFTG